MNKKLKQIKKNISKYDSEKPNATSFMGIKKDLNDLKKIKESLDSIIQKCNDFNVNSDSDDDDDDTNIKTINKQNNSISIHEYDMKNSTINDVTSIIKNTIKENNIDLITMDKTKQEDNVNNCIHCNGKGCMVCYGETNNNPENKPCNCRKCMKKKKKFKLRHVLKEKKKKKKINVIHSSNSKKKIIDDVDFDTIFDKSVDEIIQEQKKEIATKCTL